MNKQFFIIIILLLILFTFNNISENYDLIAHKIDTIEKCADISSSIYGIGGFAYNPINKNCYLSKTQVIEPRHFLKSNLKGMDLLLSDSLPSIDNSPYYNLSKPNDIICNKQLPIINQKDINNNTIIENRIYQCSNNTRYYFEKNKPLKKLVLQRNNILPITYHNLFYIDTNNITKPSQLHELNIEFGNRNTLRTNFGQKIINGDTDNLLISL